MNNNSFPCQSGRRKLKSFTSMTNIRFQFFSTCRGRTYRLFPIVCENRKHTRHYEKKPFEFLNRIIILIKLSIMSSVYYYYA